MQVLQCFCTVLLIILAGPTQLFLFPGSCCSIVPFNFIVHRDSRDIRDCVQPTRDSGFAGYSGLCQANPGQRFHGIFGIVSSKPGTAVSRAIRDCVQQTRGSGFTGYSGLCPANPGQRFRGHLGIVSSKPRTAGSFRIYSNLFEYSNSRIYFPEICAGLVRILSRSSWDIRFLLFSHIGLI